MTFGVFEMQNPKHTRQGGQWALGAVLAWLVRIVLIHDCGVPLQLLECPGLSGWSTGIGAHRGSGFE